jgi:CotH kinase protein
VRRFLLTIACLLAVPAVASADEAAQIYEPGAMVEIDLDLTSAAEAELEAEPDEDVVATFTARLTDGTPGGATTPLVTGHPVEVHLKGHKAGSFRPLSGKAAFKLKFKKSELFLGLRKMTLNNMVEDPSMLHETLSYGLFRAAGVPASRTGFAYLRVNGEDFGLYLDLENLDETSLARLYGAGNTLHLYEAEYGADADAASIATLEEEDIPEGQPKFEMDEGDPPPADLEALAGAVADTSPSFSSRLAGLADLDEMARMWAVEKYASHWDGYSGEEASNKPNNYYLHSDLAGLFQMLPWGTDNTWQIARRIGFDGPAGLLFNGCLGDTECFARYYAALRRLQGQVATLDPDALATSTAALLKPWQQLEDDESTRAEYSLGQIGSAVASVRQYIDERPGELSGWLDAHEPPPAESPAGSPPTAQPSSRKLQFPLPEPLWLRRTKVIRHRDSFTVRIRASAAGKISARALMRTAEGRRLVCSDRAEIAAAGTVALRCDLSAAARRRLAHRSLRLDFTADLRVSGHQRAQLDTVVRLPRD